MAAPIVKNKRSSVPGKIPTTTDLSFGEFGLNAYDGKVFISASNAVVGVGTTVITVNPWSVGIGSTAYNTYFNAGNVGIGTTNPTSKLSVVGNVLVSGIITTNNLTSQTLSVSGISTFTNGPVFIGAATSTGTASQRLQVTGGSYVSGNLGIGNTNPQDKLDVSSSTDTVNIRLTSAGGYGGPDSNYSIIQSVSNSSQSTINLKVISGFGNSFTALSANYEGVVETGFSEYSQLNVKGGSRDFNYSNIGSILNVISITPAAQDCGGSISLNGFYNTADPQNESAAFAVIKGYKELADTSSNGYLSFLVNDGGFEPAEKVRIASSGNVGIGTIDPTSKLHVEGDAYVSGNLGIGAISPGEKLQVDGNIRLGVSTTSNYLAFYGTTGDNPGSYNHTYIGERIWSTGTERSELLLFKGNDADTSSGQDRIRLAGGQVRIDTYTTATGGNSFENIAASANLINRVVVHSTGEVGIGTDVLTGTASQRLQVTGGAYVSGSVGIGTTNPQASLEVVSTIPGGGIRVSATGTNSPGFRLINNDYPNYFAQNLLVLSNGAGITNSLSGDYIIRNNAGGSIIFGISTTSGATSTTGFIRITPNSELLVGTSSSTSTGTTSQPLQVTGGAYVSGNLGVGVTNPASNTQVAIAGILGLDAVGNAGTRTLFTSSISGFTLNHNDNSQITFQTLGVNRLTYSHSSNFWNIPSGTPFLVGTGTSTGTASQPLQVTGGAYVSGNLGVGVTNPQRKLHLRAQGADGIFLDNTDQTGSSGGPLLRVRGQRVDSNTSQSFSGQLVLEKWRMDASINSGQNLGAIIFGGNFDTLPGITTGMTYGASIGAVAEGTFSNINTAPTAIVFNTGTVGLGTLTLANATYGTEAARITSNRNLLIGTTSATGTASQPLQVTGGAYVSGNLGVGITNPGDSLVVFKNQNASHFSEFNNPNSGAASYVGLKLVSSGGGVYFFLNSSGRTTDGGANNVTIRNDIGDIRIQPANGFTDQSLGILVKGTTGNVGIGTTNPQYKLHVVGSFGATTKSFIIDHPTKEGKKLQYGSLEGPELGVYVRGKTQSSIIELPDYWTGLVDAETITVNLTPIGESATPRVNRVINNTVEIFSKEEGELNYYYTIFAERKDVEKLEVEF